MKGCIDFIETLQNFITVLKYRSSSILVIICQILAELWPFFDLVFVGVLILVSAQYLLQGCIDFIESLHCKYRSHLKLVIIHKLLAKLWPFFDLVFVVGVEYKVKILFSNF